MAAVSTGRINMRILIILMTAVGFFGGVTLADNDQGCSDVARLDETNVRIFVVCPAITEMSDADINLLVVGIFAELEGLFDEYFISFFAREDMVGYKTDEGLVDYVSNGEWANAYLGEYYTHSHEIMVWPALPAKRVVRTLPAPE